MTLLYETLNSNKHNFSIHTDIEYLYSKLKKESIYNLSVSKRIYGDDLCYLMQKENIVFLGSTNEAVNFINNSVGNKEYTPVLFYEL